MRVRSGRLTTGDVLQFLPLRHSVNDKRCWCNPWLVQPCRECDGDVIEGCWRCKGEGIEPVYDLSEDIIVLHRKV